MTIREAEAETRRSFTAPIALRLHKDILLIDQDKRPAALVDETGTLDFNNHGPLIGWFGLKPGDTVIDVGAYVGDSSSSWVLHGCEVHAFEPFLDAFVCMTYNLRGHPNFHPYNVAIGDGSRIVLDNSYYGNDCGCRFALPGPEGIPTVRLDDLELASIKMIKIDVEGMEPVVIRGARNTLAKHRPIIFMEGYPTALTRNHYTVSMLHDLLRENGYTIVKWNPDTPIQSLEPEWIMEYQLRDLICIPNEQLK